MPPERLQSDFRLQAADLLGDRALRDPEFLGRETEIQMARDDLEDTKAV